MGDPVEQAYQEGKFPAARRAFWRKRMAKRPKATKRELGELAAMLPPPEDQDLLDQFAEEQNHTALVGQAPVPVASGPRAYPKGWLNPGEVGGGARLRGGEGTIVKEEGAAVAEPGEVL